MDKLLFSNWWAVWFHFVLNLFTALHQIRVRSTRRHFNTVQEPTTFKYAMACLCISLFLKRTSGDLCSNQTFCWYTSISTVLSVCVVCKVLSTSLFFVHAWFIWPYIATRWVRFHKQVCETKCPLSLKNAFCQDARTLPWWHKQKHFGIERMTA